MEIYSIIGIIIFISGYILIALEHKIKLNKSATALFTAGFLWLLVGLTQKSKSKIHHQLEVAGAEVFNILIFLLAAMTLVEVLIHYNFFDLIRIRLLELKLDDKKQFIIIGILTFFLSALLDNLTVSIVMTQIAQRFFKKENLLKTAAAIIIMANAGGAWSPIGDVTTIMLWLANKFNAFEVISMGLLPSIVLGAVVLIMLVKKIEKNTADNYENNKIQLTRGEKLVISVTLAGFLLPLVMNYFDLQPYIGLLLALGIVWTLIELLQIRSRVKTHLEADIDKLVKKVDIGSLKFFVGILLAVSALNSLGVLEKFSSFLFGKKEETLRIIISNAFLGIFSAIFDNVPLTAIAIDMIKTTDPRLWVLLAITVGTGGSLLLIGSVAGVVVMGMVKELTFDKYFKIAFLPALIGYFTAIFTWCLQFFLIGKIF
jgi:Na+/H+ antiporter NhaD/arsenite permease-like protein